MQRNYLEQEIVETIYFGGGTPSIYSSGELEAILEKIRDCFPVSENAEITLEANPDDITRNKLLEWKSIGINRLSIGVQSFFEEDLRWMNRAHDQQQATGNLQLAKEIFDNITIDLIYGTPQLTNEKWQHNVATAIAFGIPHLSCYALTVEPKTALDKMIREHRSPDVNPDKQSEQFLLLMQWMKEAGYEHYEISNFAKAGYRSRHNSSYWSGGAGGKGKTYLGIGPSAHSFNGASRQWNIANNQQYIKSITEDLLPFEKEVLTKTQQLNEYIMTSLRTTEGTNLAIAGGELRAKSKKFIDRGLMTCVNNVLTLTKEGKLLADGIAAELFYDELPDPGNKNVEHTS